DTLAEFRTLADLVDDVALEPPDVQGEDDVHHVERPVHDSSPSGAPERRVTRLSNTSPEPNRPAQDAGARAPSGRPGLSRARPAQRFSIPRMCADGSTSVQ